MVCLLTQVNQVNLDVRYLGRAANSVPPEIQLPGTQALEVAALEDPDQCGNWHSGYNDTSTIGHPQDEPYTGWLEGSMVPTVVMTSIEWTGEIFNCSGTDVVVQNHVFNGTTSCIASSSLTADTAVVVQSGADLTFQSPLVTLGLCKRRRVYRGQ